MAGATKIVAPALSSPQSATEADPVPGSVRLTGGLTPEVVAGVAAQLETVLGAAGPGGLSGFSSGQALQVVEAAEAVKAWADGSPSTRRR